MNGRKILLAVPCLIPSGGINVVVSLAECLQEMGYQIDLISKENGWMYETFSSMGLNVRIEQDILDDLLISWIVENYDEVIVNTLQMSELIRKLNDRDIEVKWWIHEPPLFFEQYSVMIPQIFWDRLARNVTILAAGNIVHEYISETFEKENEILNFGLEDLRSQVPDASINIISPGKITFLLPAILFSYIKGQELLGEAIQKLPESYEVRTEFIFIGHVMEGMENYYHNMKLLEQKKQNVRIFDIIERSELLMLMKQADCIVAPSRQDATNACIVEGMMLSKLCLCSNATGVSRYLQDCISGFVFPNGNVEELRARILLITDNFDRLSVIAHNGRTVYEQVFSMKVFKTNLEKYWVNWNKKDV